MGNLSQHFDKQEFDCKGNGCCDKTAVINPILVDALEQLRLLAGGKQIRINSGIRCKKHNELIGGAKDSFHVKCDAADVEPPKGMTPDKFAELAKKIPVFKNGGIGIYKSWVHLDVRGFKARWRG